MKIYLVFIIIALVSVVDVAAGERVAGESFAQEYAHLSNLLQKVQNRESAEFYKSQIATELDRLRSSQLSGKQDFDALSYDQQQQFIKKFQNNQYHCGDVTKVREEQRRILLDPDLSQVLSSIIKDIP